MRYSYLGECLNALQYVMYTISVSDIEKYVNIACAIITTIVLVASRIYQWYKNSKADGKITKDEIKDGAKIVTDAMKDLHEKLEREEKDDANK